MKATLYKAQIYLLLVKSVNVRTAKPLQIEAAFRVPDKYIFNDVVEFELRKD